MVFLSGRGGGQWDLPVQSTPAIGLGSAGGGTAGLAQLGIVFGLGGTGGGALGAIVGAGWQTRGMVSLAILGCWSIGGVCRHVGVGHAWGLGAGIGTFGGTCCGVLSR